MKSMKSKKIFWLCFAVIFLLAAAFSVSAYALEDGAYTVSRQTSYVNPETGNTVDGGTNIALGDSMCASIVEDHLLIEQANGKTYVTIGLGLMSNIENVRIQVQDQSGTYHNAEITMTGSCERSGDTCNHYRFEVYSADSRISPIIYVTPMGRDVQFFVMPDVSSAQAGTGSFVSEMIPKTPENSMAPVTDEQTQPEKGPTASETAEAEVSPSNEQADNTEANSSTDSIDNTQDMPGDSTGTGSGNTLVWVIGGIVILIAASGCVWYFCFFKKKRK